MWLPYILQFLKLLLLESLLLIVCLCGDSFLSQMAGYPQWMVAGVDSATHGMVGGLSWAIISDVTFSSMEKWLQCFFCLVLAMLVDTDHFIAARSFSLKAALSLPSRPPFHATSIVPVLTCSLFLLASVMNSESRASNIKVFAFMFTVAWLSHHIRDATRRGLWFPPFGSSRALHQSLYITLILVIPLLTKLPYQFCIQSLNTTNVRTVTRIANVL